MVQRIVRQFDPQMVVLFGSHARGEGGPDSDVDLLVVMPVQTSRRQLAIDMDRELIDRRLPLYELRIRVRRVNDRILYFFHGRGVALLAHGLTKEKAVPKADIDCAIERKRKFAADPEAHTYKE